MGEGVGLRGAAFETGPAVEVEHPGELVFGGVTLGGWDDGGVVFADAAGEDFEGVGFGGGFRVVFWDGEVVFGDFEFSWKSLLVCT